MQTKKQIVIVGFPKCGTSALFRSLETLDQIHALRSESGHIELPWPAIRDVTEKTPAGKTRLHKFPGYVYNKKAVTFLAQQKPKPLFVVCIRDPKRALVSWWNMHRNIARSDTPSDHFAYNERAFYGTCDVDEYYKRYAKERLDYSAHLKHLASEVGRKQIVVVSQERMAQNIDVVSDFILKISKGGAPVLPDTEPSSDPHLGFADKTDISISAHHIDELRDMQNELYKTVANYQMHSAL